MLSKNGLSFTTVFNKMILLLVALLINGCGHVLNKSDYIILHNQGMPQCPPDKAIVYFLFVERNYNYALAVFRNDKVIGALVGGSYFYYIVDQGKYEFWVDSGLIEKSRERVTLVAKPGKTYFIRYFPGGFYVVANLDLISEDIATAYINALDYIQANPEALTK